MFSYFVIHILFFIVLILSGHYLWNYLKDNFTEKKTKDIVACQIEKYKTIINELEKKSNASENQEMTEEDKELLEEDLEQYMATLDQIDI